MSSTPRSTALYYPFIQIRNEAWLKNALLFWEHIRTIVPDGLDAPYKLGSGKEFAEAGVIEAQRVSPAMVAPLGSQMQAMIHLQPDIANQPEEEEQAKILADKLPEKVQKYLRGQGYSSDDDETLERFTLGMSLQHAMMTLVANHLASNKYAPVTDMQEFDALSTHTRLDGNAPEVGGGLLARLTLEQAGVDETTPVHKILAFRDDHKAERAAFRRAIHDLSSGFHGVQSLEEAEARANDIYLDQIVPALSAVEEQKSNFLGQWLCAPKTLKGGATVFAALATISAVMAPAAALLGAPATVMDAAPATAGVAVMAARFNKNRKAMLASNPVSSYTGHVKQALATA